MTDPSTYAVAETLRNGLAVTIRALRADDRERVAAAVRGLDRESIYTRLFSYRSELTAAGLDRIMHFDADREVVLLATLGTGAQERVIGGGRYVVGAAQGGQCSAEVAFTVEEDYHGLGLAGRLLRHLAAIARERGIAAFDAEVLAGNKPMLAVFAKSGLAMHTRREGGVEHVTLTL